MRFVKTKIKPGCGRWRLVAINNRQRNGFNSLLLTDNFFTLSQDNNLNSLYSNSLKDNDIKINYINNNEELIIKMINSIKERIYQDGKKQDKIYEYFDVLLSHNEKRKHVIFGLNSFNIKEPNPSLR